MNLRSHAMSLARQGRGGDSTLVHMRPDEVAAMRRAGIMAGTPMTVNPKTGLPEAFKIKDLFNINTYTKPIRRAAEQVGLGGVSDAISSGLKTAGNYAQYIIPFIPGGAFAGLGSLGQFAASPMGRGLLAGGIGSLAGGRFNLKRGLMSGLTAYGLSGAYQGLQKAGGVPTPGAYGGDVDIQPGGFYGGDTRSAGEVINQAIDQGAAGFPADMNLPDKPVAVPVPPAPPTAPTFMNEIEAAGRGIKNIALGDKSVSDAAQKAFSSQFGRGATAATYMGVTGMAALDEQEKYLEEAKRNRQISEADYAKFKARISEARRRAEEAVRRNPYQFALGGEISDEYKLETPELGGKPSDQRNVFGLAAGGMPPRYLQGDGDGMSDSIKARIGGIQEARLADGEFVIPADVVSGIGNGSSNAGAKQLYAMMDRVRQARTGTKEQGKEINPNKMMPV